MLTEDQIETRIEHMINHLDRVFLAGEIDEATYESNMRDIHAWAEAQYLKHRDSKTWSTLGEQRD
jgi:hypothetical protein